MGETPAAVSAHAPRDEAAVETCRAALKAHHGTLQHRQIRELFDEDQGRFDALSLRVDDLLIDASKNRITAQTLKLLHDLAHAAGVEHLRDAMFSAQAINVTENRAVLHTALRSLPDAPITLTGSDVMPAVTGELQRLFTFADAVRSGAICGVHGDRFTDIVNIGIGGSDLGPAMACRALAPYHDGPRTHFVSNVDGAHLADTLAPLNPASTLFLVASKTFTTIETMTNAQSARAWITDRLGEAAVATHFTALSTALDTVAEFGILPERTFGFWDWVGGRYSLWSAIGLALMIAIGPTNFEKLLAGGRAMDEHFRSAPLGDNAPILLGLIGVWNREFEHYGSRALIPYDQRLERFPAFVQQLDMESNGKSTTRDGMPVSWATGPVVWGEPGTNAQHAFFQLIHQGSDIIPTEFLVARQAHEAHMTNHHAILVANCLAQSEALMRGRTIDEVTALLSARGLSKDQIAQRAPHMTFAGNRPSTTLAYGKLDPFTLGSLIALYEHRVFVEGAIWNINSFDQWGVELGKELASELLPILVGEQPIGRRDASTLGLLRHLST